ncbi:MAG: MaoC/PaaZ C-terminal domain-containing protein [Sulfurifustis sp.]
MKYFEDFRVGTSYRLGQKAVTKESILRFAQEFDRLPFHVDEDAARRSMFGGLIASGLQTLCLAASIIVDDLLIGSEMTGGLGMSDVRWLKPVRPGDAIEVGLVVAETEIMKKQPELGRIRVDLTVFNQDEAVVMTAAVDYLFKRREHASLGTGRPASK